MKCITCSADIPPAWVHAIQKNECPGCSGPIYSEQSKQLMDELREAMLKMSPIDAESIAGWILSNYNISKLGETVEPTNFHRKPTERERALAGGANGLKIAPNQAQAQRFMRLAGADKVIKDPKVAAIVEAINSVQSEDDLYPNTDVQEQEAAEEAESEAENLRNVVAAAKRQGRRVTAAELLANNVPMDLGGGKSPLSSEEIQDMQEVVSSTGERPSEVDPPNIQRDRYRRLMAQKEISSGGACGVIRRG